MGMGFTLGLKDDGFDKGMKDASQKSTMFQRSIEGIKGVASGLGGMLKGAFRLPQVGPALSQIQSIANDYKITTTQVEALGIAADKVSSQTIAGLNLSSKEAKKFRSIVASVSYGLNMDAGTVTKSLKGIVQSNIDIRKIGFKSFTEYQKFLSVTGVDSEKFAATVKKLSSQFGMSNEQIKDTLTSVIALGKRFNLGNEAAQSITETVGMLGEEGAALWAELGPDKTKKFLEGTQSLSVAFMKAGHTAQEAQDLALGVGRAMIKGRAGVQQLFSGLSEDLPEAMQSLTENFGSVEGAFQMLQQDPAKFTKMIAVVAKKIKDTAKSPADAQEKLARFSNQMSQSFGPQFTALIGGSLDTTVGAFAEVEKELNKPGGLADKNGVLGKIAQNYRDGLTPAERLSRAQDRFRTGLKKMMGETDAEFLNRFNHSATVTSKKLAELAKQNGPLGKATSLLVEFSNHGLGGVASKISSEYGPAMATLIQQFGPVIQHLGAIVPAVMALLNPFTLVAGAIAGLYFYFKEAKEGGGKFKSFIDNLIPKIGEFAKKLFTMAKDIAPKIGQAVLEMFKTIDWNAVAHFVYDMGGMLWDMLLRALELLGDLGKWLIGMVLKIDWGKLGDMIYEGVAKLAKMAFNALTYFIKNIPALFGKLVDFVGHILWKIIQDLPAILKAIGGLIWDSFVALGEMIKDIFVGVFKAIGRGLEKAWDFVAGGDNVIDIAKQKLKELEEEQTKAAQRGKEAVDNFIAIGTGKVKAAADLNRQAVEGAAKATQDIWASTASQTQKLTKAQLDETAKMLNKGIDFLAKKSAKAKQQAATDAALAGAAKELGISTGDAAEVIKAVAGMSPADVKRSLQLIKTAYIDFLKESAKQSKALLDDSRKYFNQFIADQNTIWADKMTLAMRGFTDAARNLMTTFWNDVISQARRQSIELIRALNGAVTNMNSVMMGTYGAPMETSPMYVRSDTMDNASGVNPLNNLIKSINDPMWVTGMKDHMDKQSDKVVKAIRLLAEIQNAPKAKNAQQEFQRLIDANDDNSTG